MALLSLQNVYLRFGSHILLEDATLQIERNERVCLLGRNGTGKSTLLRAVTGEIAPNEGTIVYERGVRIARLSQEVPQGAQGTVAEVIAEGAVETGGIESHELDALVTRLKLNPEAQFATLSGGLKRRTWLGRALAAQPDLLLLDEPTNHLDIDSIAWLEDFLLKHVKSLLFVTHDRAFLRKLSTRIVEIDRGKLYSWNCGYDQYVERKESALAAEAKERAVFDKRLAQEEIWGGRTVEARRTKAQSRMRALEQMRKEKRERRERIGQVKVTVQEAEKSGRLVAEAEGVSFAYPGHPPVFRDFSTIIMRGDKVGVMGPNGAGKTTLLRLLLGELQPTGGELKLGTNQQVAYFDQLRNQLVEDQTVQWNVAGENSTVRINGEHQHIVGYLQDFLFSPERGREKVGVLSGGERNRLLLAKLFTQPANVLVMDEPTNDLDMETLDLLENLLVEFPGTVLLVSHDRAFLNDVVSSTLVFEKDANGQPVVNDYAGGYDDWLRQRPTFEAPAPKVVPKPAEKTASRPRKLSFKEAKELETLPAKIEALEKEQHTLAEKMGDAAFYANGGDSARATARLAEIETELLTAFERWEELLEIEKLAGG
jgi:ATP-binding cassette subfamily F protein uup